MAAATGPAGSQLIRVSDLPGDPDVAHLNAELAAVIARDVLSILDTTPRSAWAPLVRQVLARIVTVEAQLLTTAAVEQIERRCQVEGVLRALREGPRQGGHAWGTGSRG